MRRRTRYPGIKLLTDDITTWSNSPRPPSPHTRGPCLHCRLVFSESNYYHYHQRHAQRCYCAWSSDFLCWRPPSASSCYLVENSQISLLLLLLFASVVSGSDCHPRHCGYLTHFDQNKPLDILFPETDDEQDEEEESPNSRSIFPWPCEYSLRPLEFTLQAVLMRIKLPH